MKKNIHSIRLRHLQGELTEMVYELSKVQFSQFPVREGWTPAINAYRCARSLEVCMDLAGVEQSMIEINVEPGRLLIRGQRPPPEPETAGSGEYHMLAMEIDSGIFERTVTLPAEVDAARITAHHRNGWLWIHLPLRLHA